ncbi:YCF-like [Parasponia andersonii]|uniref:YCF-like n=1 Tax=Parasponia andersonii TaxID=3476 RepID=A0A2P5BZ63_PARAD|nr:YCF-like [Parasponia andersonii]
MAATATLSPLLQTLTLRRVPNELPTSFQPRASRPSAPTTTSTVAAIPSRRRLLLLIPVALTIGERPSMAEDIPLFGLRRGLRKAEEKAEEIVREGFEAADKGLQTAERGIETAEKGIVAAERGIETAEKEIETAVSFDGLAQAGAVAGAEVLGVLVATSIVNGILGLETQKS